MGKKQGLSPGTLVYTGKYIPERIIITAIHYNEHIFEEKEISKEEISKHHANANTITWINIEGLNDTSIIEKVGEEFNLHTLLLEDVLNVFQIPKLDDYEDEGVLFLTVNEFFTEHTKNMKQDQVSLILGKNFVVTFQEKAGDAFGPVRERIREGKGRLRKKGSDYLAYAILDALVDSYYAVLDKYNEELLGVEDAIIGNPKRDQLAKIHNISKDLITFRKSVAPLKEIVNKLINDDTGLVHASLYVYLRDLNDHVNQIINTVDTDREFLGSLINTNLTNINNRMNEIVKVLTVVSAIFIPLTFIVGVYGMNFENFPELRWHYGYFILWGIMILIVAIQISIFKKNKWL
ncbi:MAG: magnesium/cobalt transporter CorA [Chitinophagales bacterium]